MQYLPSPRNKSLGRTKRPAQCQNNGAHWCNPREIELEHTHESIFVQKIITIMHINVITHASELHYAVPPIALQQEPRQNKAPSTTSQQWRAFFKVLDNKTVRDKTAADYNAGNFNIDTVGVQKCVKTKFMGASSLH